MFSTIKTYSRLLSQVAGQTRTCQNHNITENFTYDNLNRLRTYTVEQNSIIEEFEVQYYPNGNVDFKSDVGKYIYDPGNQPHAVKNILPFDFELDETENYTELTEHPFNQNIQYNSFNKATKITATAIFIPNLSGVYPPPSGDCVLWYCQKNILLSRKTLPCLATARY